MPEPRRALLVIDVQNEYVDGALPIVHPPLATSLPNIAAAMAAARDAHVPVLLARHVDDPDSPVFAAGSRGAALHETVAGAPHDRLFTKGAVSCFADTDLGDWLDEHGIDTLSIAGFMTQHCDESTARDGADRGLIVEVLSDATGTLPLETPVGTLSAQQLHEQTLIVLASGFAAIATTATWIEAVGAARPLDTPDLWASTEPARAAAAAR